ncbi:MAG: hypothetical protein HY532_08280 [Chloroflexi bacterium]|nr:hypothetical protein [Chloroflexota bacterium]
MSPTKGDSNPPFSYRRRNLLVTPALRKEAAAHPHSEAGGGECGGGPGEQLWLVEAVGAGKGYDTREFVAVCREMGVTHHVAQRVHSTIDRRTARHSGYGESQRARKRVVQVFGWTKHVILAPQGRERSEGTVGGGRKLRYKGVARNQLWAEFTAAAYNLVRLAKLLRAPQVLPQRVRCAL